MKSTTWPFGKPGLLNKRSTRFPTTPPRARPMRISHPVVLNFGPNQSRASDAIVESKVKTQVADPPSEKAALSLNTRVNRTMSRMNGTVWKVCRLVKARDLVI